LKQIKTKYFEYKTEEDKRIARILLKILVALLATYTIVIGAALYYSDWTLVGISLTACGLLAVPLGLLALGKTHLGTLVVVWTVLIVVTIIATVGQGIHDIAIMAFPVIIIIASLLMQRREFILSSVMTLIALAWLVFGEAGGLFSSKSYVTPNTPDFIVAAAVLLVAIRVVDLLAENLRGNMQRAQQEIAQRKSAEVQLRHQSIHDGLTGLYNRTFFEEELERMEHSLEFPVSIIIADLDGLKKVNDTQGHAAGDELLRRTSIALRTTFRASDMLARIGGDEFAVLLPCTDSATAEQMLARVYDGLDEHNHKFPDLPVCLSLGTSTAEQGKLAEALVLADQRMYANKNIRKAGPVP
jgi:diguanylate cyclase (GGDEF)-like protein